MTQHPDIIPMLTYEGGLAALDWLARAFGFRERLRMLSPDGLLAHVDDVNAHYVRAKAAGATILSEPESGFPGRRYRAEDLEGHRWMFLQREPGAAPEGPASGG